MNFERWDACLFIVWNSITFTLTLNAMILRRWHYLLWLAFYMRKPLFNAAFAQSVCRKMKANQISNHQITTKCVADTKPCPTQLHPSISVTHQWTRSERTTFRYNGLFNICLSMRHYFCYCFLSFWCCHISAKALDRPTHLCARGLSKMKTEGKFPTHKIRVDAIKFDLSNEFWQMRTSTVLANSFVVVFCLHSQVGYLFTIITKLNYDQ